MDYCVIGYHGLPREYVKDTIARQVMHESTKDNEWLGSGVYFFQYLKHAEWWLTHKRYINRETAILQAKLKYNEEQLLDLDDPETRDKVEEFFNRVRDRRDIIVDSISLPVNPSDSQKWCFACNLMKRIYEKIGMKIGIIVYTFPVTHENEKLFPDNQRQFCVSDHSIISEIKEVEKTS